MTGRPCPSDGWEEYDPEWLVRLAREHHPDLADALARCKRARSGGRAYLYFVDATAPNRVGSEWQFQRCAALHDSERGDLIVDILEDGRVGGVEFLGCIPLGVRPK